MWKRVVCALVGSLAGTAAGLVLDAFGTAKLVGGSATSVVGVLGMILALYYGQRKGIVPSREEAHRPISLFSSPDRR